MVAVCALVSGLDAELVRLGYKDSTMVWYRGCWRRLQKYFAARGVEEFSLELAMAWVDEACGFFAKEQAGTLKQTDVHLFRVAQMLGDYAAHGAVIRVALKRAAREFPVHPRIERIMHEQVSQQGRNRGTLRGSLLPRHHGPIGHLHRRGKPPGDVQQDPPLAGVVSDRLE